MRKKWTVPRNKKTTERDPQPAPCPICDALEQIWILRKMGSFVKFDNFRIFVLKSFAQCLTTLLPESARPATRKLGVVAGHIPRRCIAAHLIERRKQARAQVGGEINLKNLVAVLEQSVRRSDLARLFDEQRVRGELHHIRFARRGRTTIGLDLDGDDGTPLLDDVIWFAGQRIAAREQGLFDFFPRARVGVNDARTERQAGARALFLRGDEKNERRKKHDEEKRNH